MFYCNIQVKILNSNPKKSLRLYYTAYCMLSSKVTLLPRYKLLTPVMVLNLQRVVGYCFRSWRDTITLWRLSYEQYVFSVNWRVVEDGALIWSKCSGVRRALFQIQKI